MNDPSKLYSKLQELSIETGKLGNNEISAWYDTFDTKTIAFLQWFQENISSTNILTISEEFAQEELVANNLFLEGIHYENALSVLQEEYGEIFNEDINQYECELLQSELAYYKSENIELDLYLAKVTQRFQALKQNKDKKLYESTNFDFRRDEAFANCLETAEILDNLHAKLAEKSLAFNLILPESDESSQSYISTLESSEVCSRNIPDVGQYLTEFKRDDDYDDINTFYPTTELDLDDTLNSIMACNYNGDDSLNLLDFKVARKDEKSILNTSVFDQGSNLMVGRLVNIANQHKWITSQINLVKLSGKKNSLITNSRHFSCTCDEWEINFLKSLKEIIHAYHESINGIEKGVLKTKIEHCMKMEFILDKVIQYQLLILKLISYETELFKSITSIMHDLKTYVEDLNQCKERTQSMKTTISEYTKYCSTPVEQRCKLIKKILEITGADSNLSLDEALNAITEFDQKFDLLARKLFIDDVDVIGNQLQTFLKANKKMASVLSNKATGKLAIVPSVAFDVLRDANDMINDWSESIKYHQGLPKKYSSQLESDKYTKLARQIWMYIVVQKHEMVKEIIDEFQRMKQADRMAFFST